MTLCCGEMNNGNIITHLWWANKEWSMCNSFGGVSVSDFMYVLPLFNSRAAVALPQLHFRSRLLVERFYMRRS